MHGVRWYILNETVGIRSNVCLSMSVSFWLAVLWFSKLHDIHCQWITILHVHIFPDRKKSSREKEIKASRKNEIKASAISLKMKRKKLILLRLFLWLIWWWNCKFSRTKSDLSRIFLFDNWSFGQSTMLIWEPFRN